MSAIVLTFAPDGSAQCLHTEALPIAELGKLHVRRASTVEFNADTQRWEVRWPDSHGPEFTHESRAACIAWEVETLNARLAEGERLPTYAN